MTAPTYGIIIQEQVTAPLPVMAGDFSVIGLLLPSDDANAATFPLNTPVAFNSSDATYLGAAGTGDFFNALTAINNQLSPWQSAATVVAVLVLRMMAVTAPVVTAGGANYSSPPTVTFTAAPAGGTTATGTAMTTGNAVSSILITNPGSYPKGFAVTGSLSGGGGTGATFSFTLATDMPGTLTNLIGNSGTGTGLYAFHSAGSLTGFIPRLIAAPGYTGYQTYGVSNPVVTANGANYTSPPTVTSAPAGATATAILGTGANAGKVMAINMTSPGSYAPGVNVTGSLSGGGGSGATFSFSMALLANTLCAALPAVCANLLAVAFVGSSGDGVLADTIAWRQTMSSDRLVPTDAWVISPNTVSTPIYTDGVAEALGLQASIDFQHAGIPGWSISGSQIQGILGLKTYYTFSLTDGSTQGQQLLADQVAVIEPGAIASDVAIAASGFVWAGVWNASTNPNMWFANKRRMKDYVNLALVKAIRARLGVDNVTPHSVQAVLNDMTVLGSYLLSKQISLGFQVSFVPSENSPAQLAQGQFVVTFANETPPPITQVTVESTDYPEALTIELQTIIAQASTISPQFLT